MRDPSKNLRPTPVRQQTAVRCLIVLIAIASASLAPHRGATSEVPQENTGKNSPRVTELQSSRLGCGYDPNGAEDEIATHQMNALRQLRQANKGQQLARQIEPSTINEDLQDVALIQDDGSIIIPETKFNLKNRSVLFTPEGNGYRIERTHVEFDGDFGSRLGYFLGPDGLLGDLDNGYRDILIRGAAFPFFGVYYDTLYIGTNGYITFEKGDTAARLSASALATDAPRIAPLWADLDVTSEGDIYYRRLSDRQIITWDHAGQALYSGVSTFQAVLYDDGRIAFVYKKVKARAALVGLSPGGWTEPAQPVDFSDPPPTTVSGPVFETFSKQKRLDLPALARAFYRTHPDEFDTVYIWADFDYDNGLGIARSFNIRNHIDGIGLRIFDKGQTYGSPSRLATVITMGNTEDWPSNPEANTAGLNTAVAIVCHEQGHRWLAYVLFDADHTIKDDLLGRDDSHWSFFVDSRTSPDGRFSSLMEGNSWRDLGGGVYATAETDVNYFSPLDQYLMGLIGAEEVGPINYLETDKQLTEILRSKSPVNNFSLSAVRKTAFVNQISAREGIRVPDATIASKEFRAAFILLTEKGTEASRKTVNKVAAYRDALVNYFRIATGRRASLNGSLE